MKVRFSFLMHLIIILSILLPFSATARLAETQAASVAVKAAEKAIPELWPGESLSPQQLPDQQPQPNPRLEAIRHGRWPAQTASFSGAIQPDRHGPQRNDPSEGIPRHAYSPFDERRNRDYPCPPGGCQFQQGRVLIKLAPQVKLHALGVQGAWTQDAALNQALAAQGVVRLEPVFPTSPLTPFTPSPLSDSERGVGDGGSGVRSDLTRWYRAILANEKADIYATVEALAKAPGIAWAEPDYLRKLAEEPGSQGAWVQGSRGAEGRGSNPQSAIRNPKSPAPLLRSPTRCMPSSGT